ncbi:bifunctional glycosyltransferase family 2/GtrA family protein [Kitasatospora viridis]|uniref:dolichyl-phosphate beta-glucosyltransferase n=1 Tax=Kitasatospora viridis TaxID=281105 RepID=A0A561UHC0_9ACTN|nr:bifunctional glycosyltransferase family 2/GtrA family protein [Kitasatospora viridis]TWF98754.1 cellulose synthase/poly-beta-1,6-N-acetylglucosamine synthase-like glycosyltransferase [Kitasatospora viridis]
MTDSELLLDPTGLTIVQTVEVVVPVHNEERVLARSVRRLHGYLEQTFPYPFRITIADNASTDRTWEVARGLAEELSGVTAVHLELKGRGRALRRVWSESSADVVAYMDVDLSTGLDAFLPLVAPLLTGHSDLAIGTRLHRGSAVVRGAKRELVSRGYNALLRTTMAASFSDAQCGFKAVRTELVRPLLAEVEDEAWFFDTELLLLAERAGLRIHEVPVDWVDDPDSRVDVLRTALDDLRGMARMARASFRRRPALPGRPRPGAPGRGLVRQLASFAVIGFVGTVSYLLLYLWLRGAMPALAANFLAQAVTAVASTTLNRRFTFGVRGGQDALRHQLQGGAAFVIGVVLSSGAIGLLAATEPHASHGVELATLVVANACATAARFTLMRLWVFRPAR